MFIISNKTEALKMQLAYNYNKIKIQNQFNIYCDICDDKKKVYSDWFS